MKIKRPDSPFQGSVEPIDPKDSSSVSKAAKTEFADALTQLESDVNSSAARGASSTSGSQHAVRTALMEIASRRNLTNAEDAARAVTESARFMIRSRISERYRDTTDANDLVDGLSDYVASDPLLKPKLLSILKKIKAQ